MLNKIHQHSEEPSTSTPYVILIEVFVKNFIGATNNHNSDQLTHVSRCLLHGIHSIFFHQKSPTTMDRSQFTRKDILGVMARGIT